jgi:ribonuclease-3
MDRSGGGGKRRRKSVMEQKVAREEDYPQRFLAALPLLEERIDYRFQNRRYLWIALTHSSFSNDKRNRVFFEHNERQEFLGDSVLSLVISRHLFADHTTFQEGVLTKLRASSVCADALFEYARKIDLGSFMLLNHGLEEAGGRNQKNILADCFEALLAAIYLDSDFDTVASFVMTLAKPRLCSLLEGGRVRDEDYKGFLQEKVQTSPGEKLEYHLVAERGPAHQKEFEVEVCLNSNVIGHGKGKSKREAEQEAARMALATWFGETEKN